MLFPKHLKQDAKSESFKKVCASFELIGAYVARAILDDRLIDVPLSPLFWDLVLEKQYNLYDLKRLDEDYYKIISDV